MSTVIILGKLGKNIEVKKVGQSTVGQFSVAQTVGFGDKKQTMWYDCSLWGKQAESSFIDYLNKGREVQIVGELSQHEHNGKTYLKVRIYDIKLTSGTKDAQPQQNNQPQNGGYGGQQSGGNQPAQKQGGYGSQNSAPLDDDLPFMRLDSRLA